MAWSRIESASRMDPSPLGQQSESASSASIFSRLVRSRSWPTMSSNFSGAKTEVLAARANGLGNVLGLRGGQQ